MAGFKITPKIKVKKRKSLADQTCVNFTTATHNVTQSCLWPPPILSGRAPDESADGVLGDFLPELDQGISELLDSLWGYLVALDILTHNVL